jgi:predicted phosphodiesterase
VTRWGLLSDIHGNLPALEAALASCRERGVERYAVLGDNLGRGDAQGCVERIQALAEVSVVGNRDLDWIDRCGDVARTYVLSLPREARSDGLIATHGDARLTRELSSNDIRHGFVRARPALAEAGARIWLFGHTHRARVWRLPADGASQLLLDAAVDALPARIWLASDVPGDCWAVNVGSVGLPFPGKGPASFAIYDSEARTVDLLLLS